MGLFGRKYDGSAIRNAEPAKPETLAFMNGPDLLGNPTSGQTYQDPRGPMQYTPKPTFLNRLGKFAEGVSNDLLHMRGVQNTGLDQRRAMEMYKQQQADTLAQYEAQQRIAAQYRKQTPYRWESNNGSLMEIGEDGQPRLVYQDPTPKVNWVRADNGDGTFTMVPMSQGGATQPNELDTLPEGYSVRGAGSGQRGFPHP